MQGPLLNLYHESNMQYKKSEDLYQFNIWDKVCSKHKWHYKQYKEVKMDIQTFKIYFQPS